MPILHRTQTLPALMPRFVERFRCIGSSCEDNCCSNWAIYVDKRTYDAYREESTAVLDQFVKNIVRFDGAADDGHYAAIMPIGERKLCPALQDGLCSVHATLGETYLPNTCDSYPRTNRRVNGQLEQMITLSCPEAARLALLAEDAIDFVEAPAHLRESDLIQVDARYGFAPEAVAEIRIFCMNLMRTRELPLWQRLALLGVFCESLGQLCSGKQQARISTVIDEFIGAIENGTLAASFNPIQPDHAAQAQVFATLWAANGFETGSALQQEMIRQISARLGGDADGKVGAEALVDAYRRGLGRLDQTLADVPWLLENYVLNEMFTQLFPFVEASPYDSYLHLVARFGLLRLLLAAQCNTQSDLPQLTTLTSTVYLHCRRFQHDPDYGDRVLASLHASGWANLDKLMPLLRT